MPKYLIAEEFRKTLGELYLRGEKEVIIDFEQVTLINSQGIGKILIFHRKFSEMGGRIYATRLCKSMKEIFGYFMLDRLIPQIDTCNPREVKKIMIASVMKLYTNGENEVVINFEQVTLITSYCIGKLLMFYRKIKAVGGNIYVTLMNESFREIFECFKLDQIIAEIKPDEAR